MCEISLKTNNKDTRQTSLRRLSGDIIVNFEQILHIVLEFLLLTLSK